MQGAHHAAAGCMLCGGVLLAQLSSTELNSARVSSGLTLRESQPAVFMHALLPRPHLPYQPLHLHLPSLTLPHTPLQVPEPSLYSLMQPTTPRDTQSSPIGPAVNARATWMAGAPVSGDALLAVARPTGTTAQV